MQKLFLGIRASGFHEVTQPSENVLHVSVSSKQTIVILNDTVCVAPQERYIT